MPADKITWADKSIGDTVTAAEMNNTKSTIDSHADNINAIEANDWVTNARIANDAVDTDQIANDAVTSDKLADTYALSTRAIPSGGTAGQVLEKIDATDYNVQWTNAAGSGGTFAAVTNVHADTDPCSVSSRQDGAGRIFCKGSFQWDNVTAPTTATVLFRFTNAPAEIKYIKATTSTSSIVFKVETNGDVKRSGSVTTGVTYYFDDVSFESSAA